jgi:site-specific recombinase XerD
MRRLSRQYRYERRHALALHGNDVLALLNVYDTRSIRDLRDLAICIIGATRGFRSASIVGIALEDVAFEPLGVKIALTQEKTARNSEITYTATPHTRLHAHCMPCIMKRFIDALRDLGVDQGALFRRIDRWGRMGNDALIPQSVTEILRRGLKRAANSRAEAFSSHSFRHGVVIGGHGKGWPPEKIMQLTLHRSLAGLQPYLAGLDCWAKVPRESLLDIVSDIGVRAGQGWQHDCAQ